MFNRRWSRIEPALKSVLDAYDTAVSRPEPTEEDVRVLLETQKNLLYDSTELIEDFEKNYRRAVIPTEKLASSSFALSKGLRNHIVMQCNKMKHNHAYLGFVSAQFQFVRILGYSVISYVDSNTMGPNPDVHKQRPAFSFPVELRKVLANIYILGEEVAAAIRTAVELRTDVPPVSVSEGWAEILTRIQNLPRAVFPSERAAHMPYFEYTANVLELEEKGGEIRHERGGSVTKSTYRADGITRSFRIGEI